MLELRRVRPQNEPKPPGYNYKVDIWAIGSVFYWLLTGSPPFDKYETAGQTKFDLACVVMEGNWSLPEH